MLCSACMYASRPEEGTKSHCRWLWATMWLLRIELKTSGRSTSTLNRWAISPAPRTILILKENHWLTEFLFLIWQLAESRSVEQWYMENFLITSSCCFVLHKEQRAAFPSGSCTASFTPEITTHKLYYFKHCLAHYLFCNSYILI